MVISFAFKSFILRLATSEIRRPVWSMSSIIAAQRISLRQTSLKARYSICERNLGTEVSIFGWLTGFEGSFEVRFSLVSQRKKVFTALSLRETDLGVYLSAKRVSRNFSKSV